MFIEHLTPIENKLWERNRKLALAVYAPEGGELGVFNAIVAPLNMMGFTLIGNGYAWKRGNSQDKWWKNEVKWMAKAFSA